MWINRGELLIVDEESGLRQSTRQRVQEGLASFGIGSTKVIQCFGFRPLLSIRSPNFLTNGK